MTLVELMVTLSVLAILLAVAAPSFQGVIASNRLATATNDLIASLSQARMEAVRRGTRVTVCASSNGTQCATSGDWSQGWISFIDITRAGSTAQLDGGDTRLSSNGAISGNTAIKGSANVVQYISFGPDGRSWTMTGGALTGVLRTCSTSSALDNNSRARDLTLNAAGRLIMQNATNISSSCPTP